MKNKSFIKFIIIFSMLFSPLIMIAQSFEGAIYYKYYNLIDTVSYIFYVKGNLVKIDDLDADGKKVKGSMLINLNNKKVFSMSADRRIFMEVHPTAPKDEKMKLEINKTTITKKINGYKCTQVKVLNREQNIYISYWMANDNFDYVFPLLNTLNRKDKFTVYFRNIPDNGKYFPMLAVETNMKNEQIEKIEITKIEKKKLEDKIFEVPSDFYKVGN